MVSLYLRIECPALFVNFLFDSFVCLLAAFKILLLLLCYFVFFVFTFYFCFSSVFVLFVCIIVSSTNFWLTLYYISLQFCTHLYFFCTVRTLHTWHFSDYYFRNLVNIASKAQNSTALANEAFSSNTGSDYSSIHLIIYLSHNLYDQ